MGTLKKNKYYMYMINGYDTYAYLDDTLQERAQKLNPNKPASKYLDIISNAMSSSFTHNAKSNIVLIDSLLERKKSYRQIPEGFDPAQRPNVSGEEDNNWPEVF